MWLYRCCRGPVWLVSHSSEEMARGAIPYDAVGHDKLTASPRKTIATAQTLYIRFHLFFPYRDFRYMVCRLIPT